MYLLSRSTYSVRCFSFASGDLTAYPSASNASQIKLVVSGVVPEGVLGIIPIDYLRGGPAPPFGSTTTN